MGARRRGGFSLLEMLLVVGVIGILVGLAMFTTADWSDNQKLAASTQEVVGALSYARGRAIQTGNIHIVFFGSDMDDDPLTDEFGRSVEVLVLNDGLPGAPQQDCDIDTGEEVRGFLFEGDTVYGVSSASAAVPSDEGGGTYTTGSSFDDGDGSDAHWILFRPEGLPVGVDTDCDLAAVGTGGGSVYVTNGNRDEAIVLTPLGGSRVHRWDPSGAWSS